MKLKNRWLIAASAVGIHLSIGAVYAYSVYKKPFAKELGWEASSTSLAFSLAILFLGLSAAFLGGFVERHGPRISGMLAGCFYGVGLLGSGVAVRIESLPMFLVCFGVISGIGLGVGYITPVSTLVKWFPDRRGMATGLAIMGFGFGSLIAGPVIQLLIEHTGISNTFLILGSVYTIVILTSAQYLEPPPKDWLPASMQQSDEGSAVKASTVPPADLAQLTSREALATVRFYYLWVMLFINVTCGIAVISVASPMSQEIAGLTPVAAATMVGLMGLFNGLGRIGWASMSDKIGRPNTYVAFFLIQIFAFLVLPRSTESFLFQGVVFLIMTCYGGGFSSVPAYIGDIFGTKELSAIHGLVLTAWAAAGLVGPTLASQVRESTGSYSQTLYIFAGLFLIALVVSAVIQFDIRRIKRKNASAASASAAAKSSDVSPA